MNGCFTLIIGGTRSGKSKFAEKLALNSKKEVIYIATSQVLDQEMERRVTIHRQRRPAYWFTVEEPLAVADVIKRHDAPNKLFLLDCITVWLNNLLGKSSSLEESNGQLLVPPGFDEDMENSIKILAEIMQAAAGDVLVVTNEVGWGIVPASPLGRFYRDVAGKANQILAHRADRVYLVIAGLAQQLK